MDGRELPRLDLLAGKENNSSLRLWRYSPKGAWGPKSRVVARTSLVRGKWPAVNAGPLSGAGRFTASLL